MIVNGMCPEGLSYLASSLSFWVEVLMAKNSMPDNKCENVLWSIFGDLYRDDKEEEYYKHGNVFWSPKYFHLKCVILVFSHVMGVPSPLQPVDP